MCCSGWKRRLNGGRRTFGVLEMQDGVVVAEEVYFVDGEGMGADLLYDALDDLVAAGLN